MSKVSAYTSVSSLAGADQLYVIQGGVSKKATMADVSAAVSNAPVVEVASFTLSKASHANRRVEYNSATGGNVTIDGTSGFTTDDSFLLFQDGVGVATLVASGLTFLNPFSLPTSTSVQGSWIYVEWNATLSKYVIMRVGSANSSGGAVTKRYFYTFANQAGTFFSDPIAMTLPANTAVVGSTIRWNVLLYRISGTTASITCTPRLNGAVCGGACVLTTAQNVIAYEQLIHVVSATQVAVLFNTGNALAPNTASTAAVPALQTFDITTTNTLGFHLSVTTPDVARLVAVEITVENPG